MMVVHSQKPTQKKQKCHIQILQIRNDMITAANTLLQQPLYLTRQHPNFLFKSQNVLHGASAVQLTRTIPWDGLLKNLAWDGVYDKVFEERTFEVVGSQRSA
jgi:hypothetical protein